MATVKAKRLQDALKRAKRVGRAEEAVTIDGCSLVLQNLGTEDYESIHQETKDLEDAEYVHAYQIGHVCRAIVEIQDIDLRDEKFIEEEVPAGKYVLNVALSKQKAEQAQKALKQLDIQATLVSPDESETRTVQMERHEWIRQMLSTWSREAITVAYRKFAGVVIAGEEKAKEGVVFQIADEAAEDKFRRLLGEAKAIEGEIPQDLVEAVLKDFGYIRGSTPEEIEAMKRSTAEWAIEQAQKKEEEPDPEPSAPEPVPEPEPEVDQDEVEYHQQMQALQASFETKQRAKQQLQARQPLNRQIMTPPTPVVPPQARPVTPMPAGVPEQLRKRHGEIADLEAIDEALLASAGQPSMPQVTQAPSRELIKAAPLDPRQLAAATDKPPIGGINPRYRPPSR